MPGARVASGERVTLRTVEAEDIPFLQRGFANPEIRYPMGSPLQSREQTELQGEEADQFLVCLDELGPGSPDEDDDLRKIGLVNVEGMKWRRPGISYWLIPEVHGEGYATEAVALIVDYVFRTYDAPAIGAGAYEYNEASRGLLESLGFEEEGRRRKFVFVDGEHRDVVQYGLLREDWRS